MRLSNNVINSNKWLKIGTLLLKAGAISPKQFTEALNRSKQGESLIGSVMVRLGFVRYEELSAALYLQSLVAEGVLATDVAVKAMRLVHEQGATAQAALHSLGWKAEIQEQIDEIEYLLTESGFVSRQLYYSLVAATKCAFALVLKGTLRCNQFNEVLKAVSIVRGNVCSLDQAVAALKIFRTSAVPIETTLRKEFGVNLPPTSLRLGELMVEACIINEAAMLMALEKSLRSYSRLGDCISEASSVPETALEICLELQTLASTGVLQPQMAAKIAKRCIDLRESVGSYLLRTKTFYEPPAVAVRLAGVLKQAQLISDEDLIEAHEMTRGYGLGPIAALAVTKRIDRDTYRALWHFNEQIEKGEIRLEQAVVALMWCQRTGGDPAEAIMHISGVFPARPQAEEDTEQVHSKRLEALNAESLRLHVQLQQDKKRNDKTFCVIGCIVTLAVFVTMVCVFWDYAAYIIAAETLILCAIVYQVVKSRRSAANPTDDEVELAQIVAVRRKPLTVD